MRLAIIDSNVLDMIQPGARLEYLTTIPDLEVIPSRKAREEAEALGRQYATPQGRSKDAPVPLITNDPHRKTNDPAAVSGVTHGMKEVVHMRQAVYSQIKSGNHVADQEVIGSAIDFYENKKMNPDYNVFYFISADQTCCRKACTYFRSRDIAIELLQARQPGAKMVTGVRDVGDVFPP